MGRHHAGAVADFIHEFGRQNVHHQLDAEIEGHQQRDPVQRDGVGCLKGEEEQGSEIVDDRLNDIPHEAGAQRVPKILPYVHDNTLYKEE